LDRNRRRAQGPGSRGGRDRLDGQALRSEPDARHRPAVRRMNAPAALGDASAFHAIFFEEADEHLASIEAILLRLDPAAPAAEDLNAIFRAAHSIKGTSGMLGFTEIAALTHVLENLLDLLRKRERPLTRTDVDAMLRACDVVKLQVAFRRGTASEMPASAEAEGELRALAETGGASAAAPAERRHAVRLGPLAQPIDP